MWPEAIVFALDLDEEQGSPSGGGSRFELLKACIATYVSTKARVSSRHAFGIAALTDTAQLVLQPTTSVDSFMSALNRLQHSSTCYESFEMGSLADVARSVDLPPDSKLRLIMLYSRSCVVPTWRLHRETTGSGKAGSQGPGVALDCLYVHERPVPGINCPQEVFTVLEDEGDVLARRAGHNAYIFESSSGNPKKALAIMVSLLAHPATRVPQQQLSAARQAPTELSAVLGSNKAGQPGPAATAAGAVPWGQIQANPLAAGALQG